MSTTTTHEHPRPIGTSRERSRTRAVDPTLRRRGPQLAPGTVISAMGPANRASGVPVMGGPSVTGYANVMGRADAHRAVSVMGAGDRGARTDLFGDSDPRFVDSLFARRGELISEQAPTAFRRSRIRPRDRVSLTRPDDATSP